MTVHLDRFPIDGPRGTTIEAPLNGSLPSPRNVVVVDFSNWFSPHSKQIMTSVRYVRVWSLEWTALRSVGLKMLTYSVGLQVRLACRGLACPGSTFPSDTSLVVSLSHFRSVVYRITDSIWGLLLSAGVDTSAWRRTSDPRSCDRRWAELANRGKVCAPAYTSA